MKITFIGGGNMGEAMVSALLDKHIATPGDIVVNDIAEVRRQYLEQTYGLNVTDDKRLAIEGSDVVVLAIKPQDLGTVMAELSGNLKPNQLVISIIAGARIGTLSRGLNHNCIVRVMPNTPAQIGMGMSVWTATAEVTAQHREWTGSILRAMGKEIYVDDENYIDMATAVMGSGPAYFFLFVESLIDAAVNIGLSREMAEELVLQTMLGSGHFIEKSGKQPAELRRMVTSRGGTTAEALRVFEEAGFTSIVMEAVTAAYNKARQLGNEQ